MNTKRIEEIIAGMNSFSKDAYHKSELLDEMFLLQSEIVGLTFNGTHVSVADLKIWDVEKHLEQLNEECGHIADKELQKFEDGCKTLSDLIKIDISGRRGEYKAFRALEYMHSQKIILKNIELCDEYLHTELDAVVITPKCLTIVEIKNTKKDVFIDENGDYYRTGEYTKLDCNIAEKMSAREELLRKILWDAGITDIPIRSVVVFTNNYIEVQNKHSKIKTCFVNQLKYFIDEFKLDESYTMKDMEQIQNIIETAKSRETYPLDFNVHKFKLDFAVLMATLESASADREEVEGQNIQEKDIQEQNIQEQNIQEQNIQEQNIQEQNIQEQNIQAKQEMSAQKQKKAGFADAIQTAFSSKYAKYAGNVVAVVAASLLSATIAANAVRKGGC